MRIRKLIFWNHSLNFVRLAFDAISKTSISFNGHMPNDCVNHGLIGCLASLWALSLVANIFV